MPQLSVTDSESVALTVLTNISPSNCNHRTITYELDGVSKTLQTSNGELAAASDEDAERAFVVAFLRFRRARGKSELSVRIA